MKQPDGLLTKYRPRAAFLALLAASVLSGCAARTSGLAPDPSLAPLVEQFASALASCAPNAGTRDRKSARSAFEQALTAVTRHSLYEVDPKRLTAAARAGIGACDPTDSSGSRALDRALDAMVEGFDPYGSYLSPSEYTEILEQADIASVGLELVSRDDALLVLSPVPGSPAAQAGIAPRDRILAIDGQSVNASDLVNVFRRLQGLRSSSVSLTVQSGQSPPRVLNLQRDIVRYPAVWSSTRNQEGVATVRLRLLTDRSGLELFHELNRLEPIRGLVLDLRSNTGGLLSQAVAVADLFVASGEIARAEGREKGSDRTYFASGTARWSALPIVVLVDQRTAAGAEIIAAALRFNGAKVVGTQTSGRGTAQTLFPIGRYRALELTTGQMFTPTGAPVAAGIRPDIVAAENVDVFDLHTEADPVLARAMDVVRSSSPTKDPGAATPALRRPSAP